MKVLRMKNSTFDTEFENQKKKKKVDIFVAQKSLKVNVLWIASLRNVTFSTDF